MRTAVLVLTVTLAGCSADAPGPDETAAPSPVEIPCEASVGRDDADAATWVIVDAAVALPSPDLPALQVVELTGPVGDPDADIEGWWWAKHGLLVAGGSLVELAVPREHDADVRIGWGMPATPAVRVIIDCELAGDSWAAFAGGYWVREPGCYPIDVRVDGGPARSVDLGIGAPCPGQAPPPW